jgi:hypothetical protein
VFAAEGGGSDDMGWVVRAETNKEQIVKKLNMSIFKRLFGRLGSKDGPPKIIAINHDEYDAKHVGRTEDGRQFFLTTPFEPACGDYAGREFVALYLFDAGGQLLEAKIDDFGPRATMNDAERRHAYETRLGGLGKVTFARIEVAPFAIERFGTTFGLILREPEEKGDPWAVEAQPGNYMAFFEPWDSGEYDT